MTASKSVQEWLTPAKPLLIVRYLGTTPDSSSLAPLLTSICQQLSYTFMLPFEDIPDDLVPLTAHMKELLNHATPEQPLLICLDSVDQLVGSQVRTLSLMHDIDMEVDMTLFCRMETKCHGCPQSCPSIARS